MIEEKIIQKQSGWQMLDIFVSFDVLGWVKFNKNNQIKAQSHTSLRYLASRHLIFKFYNVFRFKLYVRV